MKEIVIGTAGHIDHGKTSLVKALTGIDTDRLKEEKERGITIDLGFASWDPGGDYHVGIVDVPGHERFVKNMLAGVGGIDLVLFVIAADEGVMPQTREHLAICDLLAIQDGVIALTKIDMVDEEWLDLVRDDVEEFFAPTCLGGKPIVPVSSKTLAGLEDLKQALREVLARAAPKQSDGPFRLPIDRVFSMRGFGTVVTGTLTSGSVEVEDRVEVYPEGLAARVRGLQVHNAAVSRAVAGQRTAVNLQGIEKDQLDRGSVLAHPGELLATSVLNVRFRLLADAPAPLKHRHRVRFHTGTSEVMARLYLFDRELLEPGQQAPVQARLERPLAVRPRDRFVARSYSPMSTIGGGVILDVGPGRLKRFRAETLEYFKGLETGSDAELVKLHVRSAGDNGINVRDLLPRTHLSLAQLTAVVDELLAAAELRLIDAESRWVIHPEVARQVEAHLLEQLGAFHTAQPLKEGMARGELRSRTHLDADKVFSVLLQRLEQRGAVVSSGSLVRLGSHRVQLGAAEEALRHDLEAAYLGYGLQPPTVDEVAAQFNHPGVNARELIQVLIDQQTLVRLKDNLVFHRRQLEHAEQLLREHLERSGEIAPSEFRDLLAISRKHAIPLLEYFDNARVTMRVGDKRVLRG
ncbi:MAG: selenocysteine-specific translation elongation factor [Candidatus Tectomicrobia bacterium]|nr:selenocysteine-specific translation elongation factor [Candidatus Tectomicrobia bacterium]